jgi:hypothetical protein
LNDHKEIFIFKKQELLPRKEMKRVDSNYHFFPLSLLKNKKIKKLFLHNMEISPEMRWRGRANYSECVSDKNL